MAWGYQNQQKIKDGLVYVQGKVDWYCEKTMYLDHRGKTVEEVANAYADADGKFKENFELTRDATIATAMALGRSEVKKKQVNKFKESIIQDTVSMTERAREFTEYRKDVFEREFKNQPEVLKKAKFENVRVRSAKGGWKVEQRVRVYDQAEGIYRGKDSDIEAIRRQKVLDDGDFQLRADHAQAVQEEVLASAGIGISTGGNEMVAEDVGLSSGGSLPTKSTRSLSASASSRTLKKEESTTSSADDDDSTPLTSMLGNTVTPKKAKAKGGSKGGTAASPQAAKGSPGASGGAMSAQAKQDASTLQTEAEAALQRFKDAKSIEEIPLESYVSLCKRLQEKTRSLGKRPGGADGVNLLDSLNKMKRKLNPLMDLSKNMAAFRKKQNKPNSKKVLDKWDEVLEGGSSVDDIAVCFKAAVDQAQVWMVLSEGKVAEAHGICCLSICFLGCNVCSM